MVFTNFAPQEVLNKLVNIQEAKNDINWDDFHVLATENKFYKKVPD